jgi:hypothetical protein
LGWELSKEAIIRNTGGTGSSVDDVYYLLSGGNLYPLFKVPLEETTEGEAYECENYNFWRIRYLRNQELWTVTKENGDCYSYGGGLATSADGFRSSAGNSIEWGVKWKNWIGPSDVAVGQEQFPIVWNLASIANISNERVSFEYEQTRRLAGTIASPSRRPFTKSCRLRRVTGACGDSIVLKYKKKQSQEYQGPDTSPTGAQNDVCRIVGTLNADGWDPMYDPDPRLTITVKGKDGATITGKDGATQFTKNGDYTTALSFAFDLRPDAPDTVDIDFTAEDYDFGKKNDQMLSGRFLDVVANAGIYQKDCKYESKWAALKLSYVKQQATAGDDADIYQHRQETQYLAGAELYNANGLNTEQAELGYTFLGSDVGQKRVLASITHSIRTGDNSYQPSSPGHLFEYYDERQNEGVGVGAGALYGGLKSFTSPEGSKTSYRYQQCTIDGALREREIGRPDNDSAWQAPQTYFGPDYVVVIWRGARAKSGFVYATVYQWLGRWIAAELGEMDTGVNGALHVELAGDFFAIVRPGRPKSVYLFSQNRLSPGKWDSYKPNSYVSEYTTLASGRNFLAWLDEQHAVLSRITHDGDIWRDDEPSERLGGGQHPVTAMAARDNFIVTASATPDNASLPELRLYCLDELGNWRMTSLQPEHFFERSGHKWDPEYAYKVGTQHNRKETWAVTSNGISKARLYAGPTFVLLQCACRVSRLKESVPMEVWEDFEVYRHFIYLSLARRLCQPQFGPRSLFGCESNRCLGLYQASQQ